MHGKRNGYVCIMVIYVATKRGSGGGESGSRRTTGFAPTYRFTLSGKSNGSK